MKIHFVLFLFWFSFLCSAQSQIDTQIVEKLPQPINTAAYDEVSPVLDTSGQYLFFTRIGSPDFNRTLLDNSIDISNQMSEADYFQRLKDIYSQISGTVVPDAITSRINQDIFQAWEADDSWHVHHPAHPLNNALPNTTIGYIENPSSLMVLNQFYSTGSMYNGMSIVPFKNKEATAFPEPMFMDDFNVTGKELTAFVSYDGEIIIISDQKANGLGADDLYISFFTGAKGKWTKPKHMGSMINSSYQESTPFLSRDKRKLYFSSNRPEGPGGMDIYSANRLDYSYTKWDQPVLLENDINTAANESHPFIIESSGHIYFCSDRDQSYDIFRFKDETIFPVREITIKGQIIDRSTNKPVRAELFYGPDTLVDYLEYYNTYTGKFKIKMKTGEVLKFFPKKANYFSSIWKVQLDSMLTPEQTELEIKLFIDPMSQENIQARLNNIQVLESKQIDLPNAELTIENLKAKKTIALNNIQFNKSKATVTKESIPYLKQLYRLLYENKDINVIVSGHTDNIGPEYLLLRLSKDRAEAIVKYLIAKGISSNRLIAKGYGSKKPLTTNKTETERQKNRRVEVTLNN